MIVSASVTIPSRALGTIGKNRQGRLPAVAMGGQLPMIWLYLAATSAVMVAGITYLQAISDPKSLPQNRLARTAIHGSGAAMILLFFALIIRGYLVGPWWQPIPALIIGAAAMAVTERNFPHRANLQWMWFATTLSIGLILLLGFLR